MNHVRDLMTRGVQTLNPDHRLRHAAQAMEALAVGAMPVCDGERLVGMVTDRDLVVRGMARGLPLDEALVLEVMSPEVFWCHEAQPLEDAVRLMREARVRRLPVVDTERRLVGMLSLGDIAVGSPDALGAGEALKSISDPAAPVR